MSSRIYLGLERYTEVIENVSRMLLISPEARKAILERASRELPSLEEMGLDSSTLTAIANDRKTYALVKELDYSKRISEEVLKTAFADYLLRHKDLVRI